VQAAIIVFPGSNCDRDVKVALAAAMGRPPLMVWHGDAALPKVDLAILPGGFSYGDYLRCGAMAARAPIMQDVRSKAAAGMAVLGICNGFQILTEAGLLPGALLRNRNLNFACRDVMLRLESRDSPFTQNYAEGALLRFPIAHAEGNYFAEQQTLDRLEGEGLVAFRYVDEQGAATDAANPNGSARNIAGIFDRTRRVLGLMPHPERLADPVLGGTDGKAMFESLVEALS
jgi:phosphoribosylformylglycinamidine synthase